MDAENPVRFRKLLDQEAPWPLVYCGREATHLRTLADPALGYCASFCCKEAATKALEDPFPLPQCEFVGDLAAPAVLLSDELTAGRGIAGAHVRLFEGYEGEAVAVVAAATGAPAGKTHAALEFLPLAEAQRDRADLSARCLTRGEAAEVAPRRLQTLAGFVAVKRALQRLFAGFSAGAALREGDFVLTHRPSGAPSLARSPLHPAGRLFVSLSHTRRCAYGLAVFQEP